MGLLQSIIRRKKANGDAEGFGCFLDLFGREALNLSDIESVRQLCLDNGWNFDDKVSEKLKEGFVQWLCKTELQGFETYAICLDKFSHNLQLLGIEESVSVSIHNTIVTELYQHFLRKLKKIDRTVQLGFEYEVIKYAIVVFNYNSDEIAQHQIQQKLVTVALSSIKANVRYIRILLKGSNPQFEEAFHCQKNLRSLASDYQFSDRVTLKALIFELTEDIYERCEAYLLLDECDTIFQSHERVIGMVKENMDEYGYEGKWTEAIVGIEQRMNTGLVAQN